MTHRVEEKKWILYRHTSSLNIITAVAIILKSYSKTLISEEEKKKLLLRLKDLNYYKERNPELPLDSINHRINTLAYYMFGYKAKIDGQNRFLFSPLGNLYLKHIDEPEKLTKIFFAMLWSLQYHHPHGGTDKEFNLYPFRLLFKLLRDSRLDFRLYAFEVSALIVFVKDIDDNSYESLVKQILRFRKLSDNEITQHFNESSHVLVNSSYEWDYYVSTLFISAGIIKRTIGNVICTLQHGRAKENTPRTLRKVTRNYVELSEDIIPLCDKFLNTYPFTQVPLQLNDPERLRIDVVKEIYSFYPEELLEEIGLSDNLQKLSLLNLPKLIEQYSNNNDGAEAYLFEDVLVDGFNMFYNIEAKGVGGSGKTDIECLFTEKKTKFAVDAKSTKNKLHGLNARRLDLHREQIGGKYTIVVTPRYAPAVKSDIESQPIVIIRASTFAEYLYNCIENDVREIDYSDFDEIINNNLGTDISIHISTLTTKKFSSIGPSKTTSTYSIVGKQRRLL
ncbi:hypothetical protein [Pontibacter burrus]|uniref:hypothetical protein n=1 Tax=Pontibacter burrus TaxID=2704466 RepID=UPI001954F2E4|nr:hypothetical protein [Pontibacter burrus]